MTIETAEASFDEEYCQNHAGAKAGKCVMLSVTDNGTGMDKETQTRIFEPFFTTKEPGKGTGLGLATVYGIVKQSGGFIWLYSELGEGTTFKIYLPRVDKPIVPETAHEIQDTAGHGETILLVEGEENLRAVAREFLESKRYVVIVAAHAAEALAITEEQMRSIDIVITDVVMPGLRGPDLVALLRQKYDHLKVVYMSGYTEGTLDDREFGRGTIFLQKPFTLVTLARKIREAVSQPS